MKDRAKALADHIKKTGGATRPDSDLHSSPSTLWDNLPFGKLFKKELSSYIFESSKNIEDLSRIKHMLAEVMENRISGIKQSLFLSRLSQISEAQLVKQAQLEWQESNLDEITKQLNRVGIKSLKEAYQQLNHFKQKNIDLLQEIQRNQMPTSNADLDDYEILEEKDPSESLKELTLFLDQISRLSPTVEIPRDGEFLGGKR